MTKKQETTLKISSLLFLLVFFSVVEILTGSAQISIADIWAALSGGYLENSKLLIISEIRFPRTVAAIIAGASLAVAGLQMQTVFRNPLAGPYVLGISSGAGLGVAILMLGIGGVMPSFLGSWVVAGAAWVGAGAILLLLLLVALRVKEVTAILVLGVLFGSAISATIGILQYFGEAKSLKSFVIWAMGSLGGITTDELYVLTISLFAGLVLALFSIKILDILLLGEGYAKSMGVNLVLSRILIFTGTGILAGSVTAFCGPIGFVGIIVPHIARMLFRTARHQIILPASAIIGAILLLGADIFSRIPPNGGILPISSVTAILGIPFVIAIILKAKL